MCSDRYCLKSLLSAATGEKRLLGARGRQGAHWNDPNERRRCFLEIRKVVVEMGVIRFWILI